MKCKAYIWLQNISPQNTNYKGKSSFTMKNRHQNERQEKQDQWQQDLLLQDSCPIGSSKVANQSPICHLSHLTPVYLSPLWPQIVLGCLTNCVITWVFHLKQEMIIHREQWWGDSTCGDLILRVQKRWVNTIFPAWMTDSEQSQPAVLLHNLSLALQVSKGTGIKSASLGQPRPGDTQGKYPLLALFLYK